MQFRFVKVEDDNGHSELIGVSNIDEYDTAFKMFSYMKECECSNCIMLNDTDIVDTDGQTYYVKDVMFVTTPIGGQLLPHCCVYVEEDFY